MSDNPQRIAVLEHALQFIPESELLRRGLARLKIQQFSQTAPSTENTKETLSDHTVRLSGIGSGKPPSTPVSKPTTGQPARSEAPVDEARSSETVVAPPSAAVTDSPIGKAKTIPPEQARPAATSQARRRSGASPLEVVLTLVMVAVIVGIIAFVIWQRRLGSAQLTLVQATQTSLASTRTAQPTSQAALEDEPTRPATTPSLTANPTLTAESEATPSPTPSPTVESAPAQAAPTAAGMPAASWRQAFIGISIRDGVLNIWRNDRPPAFLADFGDATYTTWGISPDGQVIIYLHQKDLWGINTDGSSQRPLLSFDQLQGLEPLYPGTQRVIGQADWVPGTHQLLFTTLATQADGSLDAQNDLYRLDTDKGMTTALLPPGGGGRFLISPDGTRLVLIYNDHLSLASINGGEQHGPFSWSPIPSQTGTAFIPDVSWSPDGKSLLVVIPFSEAAITPNPTDYAIWSILMEGPEAMQIGTLPVGPGLRHVIFSPDNEFVAYQAPATAASGSPLSLHIARSNGFSVAVYPDALPLDETGQVFTAWSPDARRLLFRQRVAETTAYMVAGPGLEPQPVLLNGALLGESQASSVGWLDASTLYYHEPTSAQVYWLDLIRGESGGLMLSDELEPVIRLLK